MKLRLVIRDRWGGEFDSEETWPGLRVGDVAVEAAALLGAIDNLYKDRQKEAAKTAGREE